MITHRDRVQSIINKETADRPAIALWRHFPVDDQTPESLAAATLHFQEIYDFDIVKVTPASSFAVRDWGVEDQWVGDAEGTRRYTKYAIKSAKDWEKLRPLEADVPQFAAQLNCLRLIRSKLGPDTPMIQTIFNPLSQAKNLAGNDTLIDHLREFPESVRKGLEVIAQTTRRFIEAAREIGIDGIFYAVQHAQASLLDLDEYRSFGLPYDLRVLQSIDGLWCNMLHLHGKDVHFSLAQSWNFPIVNWHDREAAPSLAEGQRMASGVVCGGLSQNSLVFGNAETVRQEALDAVNQTRGQGFILGTGCVVPIIASHGNLMAARKSVDPQFRKISQR